MKNRDELQKELEELSPFLQKMKKTEEGFKVTKGYFNALPGELLKQVRPADPVRQSLADVMTCWLQRLWQPRYALAFAAVTALVVATVILFRQSPDANQPLPVADVKLEDISEEALQAYIYNNIEDFDRDLILETHYAGQDGKSFPGLTPKPNPNELEQYLDHIIDDIDLEDLEDLL